MVRCLLSLYFFNDTATTDIYTYGHTLSLHDALPICPAAGTARRSLFPRVEGPDAAGARPRRRIGAGIRGGGSGAAPVGADPPGAGQGAGRLGHPRDGPRRAGEDRKSTRLNSRN